MPLPFGKPEMDIHEVHGTKRRIDDDQLGPARLLSLATQRDMVPVAKRPAGQQEVAVASHFPVDVHLKRRAGKLEVVCQDASLIVESGTSRAMRNFLQANKIRLFPVDDLDDPLKPVEAVAATDAFVDVVGQ